MIQHFCDEAPEGAVIESREPDQWNAKRQWHVFGPFENYYLPEPRCPYCGVDLSEDSEDEE